ncbi:MAG: response regulator, partial [Burkholderiales bacterium]
MKEIRVLIVDDSALVRSLLTEIINEEPGMRAIGAAPDPLVAREMIRNLDPDVITLDIEMPRMDGLDFLEKLMRLRPMPVLMISTLTERGSDATLRALELGAVDFIPKPRIGIASGIREYSAQITEKIRVAAAARPRRASAPARAEAAPLHTAPLRIGSTEKVIVIGASTGGTDAIKEVLIGMPTSAPGILVAQHMPEAFTRSFAAR